MYILRRRRGRGDATLASVYVVDEETPAWWDEVEDHFRRTRCNILFRQALSEAEQRELAERRARSVYGMSLDQLAAKTGKELGELSVHLRHAAVE